MPDTLQVTMIGASDITFIRDFDASSAVLWRAITDPAIIPAGFGRRTGR